MKYKDAKDVFDQKKRLYEIPQMTIGENLMFLMGACIDENGDIRCLTCGTLNECCVCLE